MLQWVRLGRVVGCVDDTATAHGRGTTSAVVLVQGRRQSAQPTQLCSGAACQPASQRTASQPAFNRLTEGTPHRWLGSAPGSS